MLKVEHPTDYLIKEGVNSEITDPIEEEQHTEHVYLAQKQISILKRLKRSDSDNEENIDNPQSGPSGNTVQVSGVDDGEEFFDAEENLEENHESIEVEQQGTSKQTGTVSRKRPSTEEQDKSEVKKVKLSPQKEKVKERLNTFVKAFITDFSKELAISHVRAQGKQVTLEEAIAELKQGVTGALVSYSIAYTAAASVPSAGTSARNIAGKFIHIGKTKAIKITKAFEKAHEGGLSQILSEAAAKIFRSFESQFMIVTDEAGDKMAMRKLAEDAVYRTLNYIAKNSESTSSDFITKGVILGKSEGILKRGYTLKGKSGEDLNTGELYKETGVAVSEGRVNRYYSNNRGKYGYRLPLTFEKEHGIKHLLTLLERRQFQEDQHAQETKYIYILQPGDIEKESSEILKEIEKARPATKGDIETIPNLLSEGVERQPGNLPTSNLQPPTSNLQPPTSNLQPPTSNLQSPKNIKFVSKDPIKSFTGREKELEDLDRLLNSNSDSSDIAVIQWIERLSINSSSQKASISGLGGIGKTQLALKYVEEYSEYYNNNVIWIDAETQSEILNSVRNLLNLSEFGEFRRNLNINSLSEIDSNVTERNIEVIVQEIYKYFKETKSLFIFDNVESYNEIKEYLPKQLVGNKPSILITSRYRNWENTKVKALDLDVFTDEEAKQFIKQELDINNNSQDEEIKRLAKELGKLPLALTQAVAHIKIEGRNINNAFGIQEYLEKYKTEAQKLLDSNHFQKIFHDPYAKTVFTTWKVTLSKIENDKEAGKEAIEILSIMAYLCPDKISNKMFLKLESSEKLSSAINLLKSYSMISEGTEQNISNIHRLVQKVIRINLEEDQKQLQNIAEKIVQLTKDFNSDKEIELHYLHFLLYIGKSTALTETLKLLATRERILFISVYSHHDVSSLTYLFDASYTIDSKEKYLEFVGEALFLYIKCGSLPFFNGVINYIEKREQEGIISKDDIRTILNHRYKMSNQSNRGKKLSDSQRKALELLYEFEKKKTEEDHIIPTVCSSSQRQKRNADTVCWEDVDEFNEEKDELRNPNKIRINSENFIGHIRDTPEEKKQDQLIQFASQREVIGSAKESVDKLIKHQKIKSHLEKASKISHELNTGLIAKNIGSDILRGEYESVGINLGLIGVGAILGEASQKVLAKGVALEVDKKLLGSALKVASPFLARGTSAFFVYNLIQNIKEYKSGNKDALPEIISNGVFVGVDSAEAGIEAAELLEVIEGVSEFTGPIGEAIGALIFLGTDIYHAKKQVEEIEKHVHLTEAEELTEGVRAFFGLDPSEEIEERIEVKERNNLLVKNAIEFLKKNTDIVRYVFPSILEKNLTYWKRITKHDNGYDQQKEIYCKNTAKYKCQYYFLAAFPFKVRFEVYNVSFPLVKNSNVDLREKDRYIKPDEDLYYMLSKFNTGKEMPDDPSEGKLFCLPGRSKMRIRPDQWVYIEPYPPFIDNVDEISTYFCENAIGVEYNIDRTGNYTLIAFGEGNDTAIGTPDSPNIFIANNGCKNYTGGNEGDTFLLQGNNITGALNGEGGADTVSLEGFYLKNSEYVLVDNQGFLCSKNYTYGIADQQCGSGLKIDNINRIYGRKNKRDIIYVIENLEYIDSYGGENNYHQDHIYITNKSNRNLEIVLRGNAVVHCFESRVSVDSIKYVIPRDEKGESFVQLLFKELVQHIFYFDYSLSNLGGINIKGNNIIFNLFNKQKEFNVTILDPYRDLELYHDKKINYPDLPTNARYIFQDGTEITTLNESNFYAQQNSNQTVEEIISDYPAIANRLNMTMLFKLSNNETMLIGHGAHEVMHNNPFFTSHLVGNGGENVYVITSAFNNTEKFPIPEVTLYGLNMGSFTDTLDLREVVQQSKIECPDSQVLPKINKDNNDLIIKLYSNHYFLPSGCINLSSEFLISSVRLKGTLVGNWYEKLDIILNDAPMKIQDNGKFWKLESLPLTFNRDKEIIVITPDDVEKDTELVTPREAGNYVFARSRNDLIITNAFDQGKSERCTISLKDFYQNTKMQTLSIKFADKEITLKDHQEQISIARNIDVMKKEHKDQIYNDVFNNTRSENISLEVNETTTHEIRHKHRHEHIRHKHQNTTTHQRSRREINEENIASSATRVGSRINDLFGWVKSSISGLFNSRSIESEKTSSSTAKDLPKISQVDAQVDVNGTIMLLDLLVRKITGQKYISSVDHNVPLSEVQADALNITAKFEEIISNTSAEKLIDLAEVQSNIFKAMMSGDSGKIPKIMLSYVKEAKLEPEVTKKILALQPTKDNNPTTSLSNVSLSEGKRLPWAKPQSCLSDISFSNIKELYREGLCK